MVSIDFESGKAYAVVVNDVTTTFVAQRPARGRTKADTHIDTLADAGSSVSR